MVQNKKDVKQDKFETVEPIGKRVLIRKDEDKKETKGGIQLPDNIEIPTITGRIVSISAEVEMSSDIPLQQYDKILFNPLNSFIFSRVSIFYVSQSVQCRTST